MKRVDTFLQRPNTTHKPQARIQARTLAVTIWSFLMVQVLTSCTTHPVLQEPKDGPPLQQQDVSLIHNAIPKRETKSRYGNHTPYRVLGKTYHVMDSSEGYRATGIGSWYGQKFSGRPTSSMEPYDPYLMTAAHKSLPLPTYVRVTNLENGRVIVVRVNDRGPFHDDREIDLSYAAAKKLGYAEKGTARVKVEALTTNLEPGTENHSPTVSASSPNNSLQTQSQAQSESNAAGDVLVMAPANIETPDTTNGNTPSGSAIYLQAAAFSKPEAAQQLMARLKQITKHPVAVTADHNNSIHRVRIGPFADEARAIEVQESIKASELADPLLIKR